MLTLHYKDCKYGRVAQHSHSKTSQQKNNLREHQTQYTQALHFDVFSTLPSFASLGWQFQLSAFENSSDVQIEEVTVEGGLNNSSHNGNKVQVVFTIVTVDPVE